MVAALAFEGACRSTGIERRSETALYRLFCCGLELFQMNLDYGDVCRRDSAKAACLSEVVRFDCGEAFLCFISEMVNRKVIKIGRYLYVLNVAEVVYKLLLFFQVPLIAGINQD